MVYDIFQYVHSTVIIGILQYQSEVIVNGGNRRRKRQTQQYLLLLQNVSNHNSIIVKIYVHGTLFLFLYRSLQLVSS